MKYVANGRIDSSCKLPQSWEIPEKQSLKIASCGWKQTFRWFALSACWITKVDCIKGKPSEKPAWGSDLDRWIEPLTRCSTSTQKWLKNHEIKDHLCLQIWNQLKGELTRVDCLPTPLLICTQTAINILCTLGVLTSQLLVLKKRALT